MLIAGRRRRRVAGERPMHAEQPARPVRRRLPLELWEPARVRAAPQAGGRENSTRDALYFSENL